MNSFPDRWHRFRRLHGPDVRLHHGQRPPAVRQPEGLVHRSYLRTTRQHLALRWKCNCRTGDTLELGGGGVKVSLDIF